MSRHILHTVESAAAPAAKILESAQNALGFVPNLYAVLADAPPALEAYTEIGRLFDATSLSATERQVVSLTASSENGCGYCMAAHSTIAGMQKVDAEVVEALRQGAPLGDPRLDALATFTRQVVAQRGYLEEKDTRAFLEAGYTPSQILEVVLGVTMKTLSNYASHMAEPPLDEAFAPQRWERPALAG